jgi:hypothetical protein
MSVYRDQRKRNFYLKEELYMRKALLAVVVFVFAVGFMRGANAQTAPQYVPDSVALYKDGKEVTQDGSFSGGYYNINFGATVTFELMAFPDSVTGQFLELDATVIEGDSFSIKFTPVVDGTTEAISWNMTQADAVSNTKIDPKVRAQKIATLSVSGVDYPNRKDSDHADIHVYCEYSFKRPDGSDSGMLTRKSNVIAIKAVSGGSGGGGCNSLGLGFLFFALTGTFLITKKGLLKRESKYDDGSSGESFAHKWVP